MFSPFVCLGIAILCAEAGGFRFVSFGLLLQRFFVVRAGAARLAAHEHKFANL